jgi:hypothetical protein
MAVDCEINNLVVCWKIHGVGCVADYSPHGKSESGLIAQRPFSCGNLVLLGS